MITTKKELDSILKSEFKIYKALGYKGFLHTLITNCEVGFIWKYIRYLRKDEYYLNNLNNKLYFIPYIYNRRKKNRLGIKLGINIPPNTFDEGLTIYHSGNIIINTNSRIGKNCKLHGGNCIGNNGIDELAPIIGDNADIGVGAKVIGNVQLGDNSVIGANAVVIKSFNEDHIKLVGIPAKQVN